MKKFSEEVYYKLIECILNFINSKISPFIGLLFIMITIYITFFQSRYLFILMFFFIVTLMILLCSVLSILGIISGEIKKITFNIIFNTTVLLFMTGFTLLYGIDYFADLPYNAIGNYSSTSGVVTSGSWGAPIKGYYREKLVINEVSYIYFETNDIKVGNTVAIKYLPHTKIIINMIKK